MSEVIDPPLAGLEDDDILTDKAYERPVGFGLEVPDDGCPIGCASGRDLEEAY